jgi:hypothetical protein
VQETRGIASLREKRGDQEVTFDDIADHLEDHVRRWPADTPAIERLARFLSGVEEVPHDHQDGPPTDDRIGISRPDLHGS